MEKIDLHYLNQLPARQGAAPRMMPFIPQEQLEQFPSDWQIIEQLAAFAFALPYVVEKPTGIAPDGSRALTLAPEYIGSHSSALMVGGEFAHIHNPPIGSMHLTLPKDVWSLALDKGWILRHPFSVMGRASPDVVFVYAPRNSEELEWVKALLLASYQYALNPKYYS